VDRAVYERLPVEVVVEWNHVRDIPFERSASHTGLSELVAFRS